MKNFKGPERRRHKRIPIAARIAVEKKMPVEYVFATDISLGGMAIKSEEPLNIGDVLSMDISVEGIEGLVKVTGKIVRKIGNENNSYGVQFSKFTPYSKKRLKEFLN